MTGSRLAATAFSLAVTVVVMSRVVMAQPEPVTAVERQPLEAATTRLVEALTYVGAPLPEEDKKAIHAAMANSSNVQAVIQIQKVLDRRCVAIVHINAESRVEVAEGPAKRNSCSRAGARFS